MDRENERDESRGLLSRVRASTWAALALRALVMASALFVLAFIGRATTAGASVPPVDPKADPADPGAAPPAPVAAVAPPAALDAGVTQAPVTHQGRATPDDPVFINVAGEDDLRRLPGVGPKRAASILELRRRIGHFRRVEDLMRVKGIGRATIRKWRSLVRVEVPAPRADGGGA